MTLPFTMDELTNAVVAGAVRSQSHPEFPELKIFNYTEKTQYSKDWNPVTLACRGLILNINTGDVVARPWNKFFNVGERDHGINPSDPVEVTDKLDGSLGIIYKQPDGKIAVATRGSFTSTQAQHATELLDKTLFPESFSRLLKFLTPLVEIIYPENRIVVDYKDADTLVLLGSVNKNTGAYYGPKQLSSLLAWPSYVADTFYAESFAEALALPPRPGREGYVIRSGNKMVKLKQEDYLELHRIVTNITPKNVWLLLKNGKTIEDLCVPDEFFGSFNSIANPIIRNFETIKWSAERDFGYLSHITDRKIFAASAKKFPYPHLLFAMFDGRNIEGMVWDMVKPKGE